MVRIRAMKLISTVEAAEKLGVSERRVRSMIEEGKITTLRVGGRHLIEAGALSGVKVYGKAGRPPAKKAARQKARAKR